jgi:hypothetical protein
MKDSIKREQSQTCLNSAERENSRTKCRVKIQTMLGDIVVRQLAAEAESKVGKKIA